MRGIVLAAAFVAACGACKQEQATGTAETGSGAGTQQAAPPPGKPVDPATAGSIAGTVTFAGTPPAPTMIIASSDAACTKVHSGEFDAGDVLVKDGKVQNAFVWIKSGLEAYAFDPPAGPVKVDQKGCMYEPRVVGARVGQDIEFMNSDQTLHNIASKPTSQQGWNFVTPQGSSGARKFKKAEVPVRVGCDVHPWMRAFVGVVDHPKFQVTGADGAYSLDGIPPGTYVLAAWHERLGTVETTVTVAEKEAKTADLVLPGK